GADLRRPLPTRSRRIRPRKKHSDNWTSKALVETVPRDRLRLFFHLQSACSKPPSNFPERLRLTENAHEKPAHPSMGKAGAHRWLRIAFRGTSSSRLSLAPDIWRRTDRGQID